MEYTIKAKETKYRNLLFRSRLEAKWAAFFDLRGIGWLYEPMDLSSWTPDFLVVTENALVEIKPVTKVDDGWLAKVRSISADESELFPAVYLFGLSPAYCWKFKFTFRSPLARLFRQPPGASQSEKWYAPAGLRSFSDWEPAWNEAHNLTRFTYPNG